MARAFRPCLGGNVFGKPLRRDPLFVCWVVVNLVAAFVALSDNTTWSGHLEADRIAAFLQELSFPALLSLLVLLFIAWVRARAGGFTCAGTRPWRDGGRAFRGAVPSRAAFEPYPWTDRWLRDWREADARRRSDPASGEAARDLLPVTCRHGAPLDVPVPSEQAPVLRALSVSHSIVRPGCSVSVTWCFEHCDVATVDGRGGYPACGEALVRIDRTRRIEIVGRNHYGSTPVATASVVAMSVPQLDLPTLASPPPVSLQTHVTATVGGVSPVTQRLDHFWATQEALRPRISAPGQLVGVPSSVIDGLRRVRRSKGKH